jgi:hypothetical protein
MTIDAALWASLESESNNVEGVLRRRILADTPHDTFVAVVLPGRQRQLIFRTPSAELAAWRLDETQIVKPEVIRLENSAEHELRFVLTEPEAGGVFTAFCNDLIDQLRVVQDREDGVKAVYQRYKLWRRLLGTANRDGLDRLQQQGLFGELQLLIDATSNVSHDKAVNAWNGPMADTTDFVFGGYGIEVKTASSKAPEIVKISSEKQLSSIGLTQLLLCVYVLVVREEGIGMSLPNAVESLRSIFSGYARFEFERRLIEAGYTDAHSSKYEQTKYTVLERKLYSVESGFPSIVQELLPSGVGNVSYSLSLDACAAFRISNDAKIFSRFANGL